MSKMSKISNWKPISINPNYCINCIGQVKNNKTNKSLNPKVNTKGQYVVKLKLNTENTENTEYKLYKIDKLVAKAFIENPNNLQYVKHKNGLLNDNRVSNIEWTANNPITTLNTLNNLNTLNTNIYPKIKHFVKYAICKNENNHSKKQLYFKTEKEALERIKTIQLTNPEYKSKVQKKVYYLTEITYNEKKFYKKHQDYLLVHRLHRQMYLVIKYCNLFLKLLNKNK
jgi:hypothetical protein